VKDYSQCLPGTASTPVVQPATSTGSGGSTPISTGPAGSGPGTTLTSGYYWIRAVAAPNFHKYLQTTPVYTTGTAIMGDYTTAGQFNIVDGQLVELISGGLLYANVAQPTTTDQRTIAVTFETTKNTFGAFAFNGDAVTWSVSSINRPNLAAWYVCANQALFINLGAYAYNGPSGCADQTVCWFLSLGLC
jgi:hypothetical protein